MPGIEEAVKKQNSSRRNPEQVRVGIIGYGTVGRATAENWA
jgi:lactate dehydrogenase-like 2-hydroxyacid dehydrogenase